MGKVGILVFILILGALALFSLVNNDVTTIEVPFDKAYEVPKMALIIFSGALGALSMLMLFLIRDTRRFFVTYQLQRQRRREERLEKTYSRALNAILAGDEGEARTLLDEIVMADPEYTEALLRLGDLTRDAGHPEEAAEFYRRALSSAPHNLEAMFAIAEMMRRLERWSEASTYVEKILEEDGNNLGALYRKRDLLERVGRWDDVIDLQKTIVKIESSEADVARETANMLGFRYELAREGLERGEVEKANKAFRAILRESETFIPAYLGVAEVLLEQNAGEEAVSFLEKGYETTGSQILLARLEDMLIGLGEPSRLIRIFRSAIAREPENTRLKFFLAKLYFRLEMIDDAFDALAGVEMEDAAPEFHNLMGALYLRRNDCVRAVEEFKRTASLSRTLRVPYCCRVCRRSSAEWSGRCPNCRNWNTYRLDIDGSCRV
jgi:lipopolysaccharide biosynthesis regulator YciM